MIKGEKTVVDPQSNMSNVAAEQFAAALAGLDEERRKLSELQERIAGASTVINSKDRLLSLTFDGRGELTKLVFNNTNYRRMAPPELAAVIMETFSAGRTQALEKLGSLAGHDALPGVSLTSLAKGEVELNNVVDAFLGAALEMLPDNALTPGDRAQLRKEA
jgi:DNA-binding protein YbaB